MRVILNGEHAMIATRLHELTLRVMNCSKLHELPGGHRYSLQFNSWRRRADEKSWRNQFMMR